MADGGKGPISGLRQNIGEAIVKPVVDEVGKALELGAQSVLNKSPQQPQTTTPQLDPAQQQQIQMQEQVGLTDARRKIKYWQDLSAAQAKVREDQKRQEQERLKQDEKKKEVKQFQIQENKKQNIALQQAKTKTETRKGVGG